MKKRRIKSKSWLIVIGFLLFFLGTSLIIYDFYHDKQRIYDESIAIERFYINKKAIEEKKEIKEQQKINYIAVLKIPKIKFERGLVNPNSYLNNINYNIEILDESSMPNEVGGNVILAAHSGNTRISYFKDLDKLSIGDDISIDYQSNTYNYKVVDIYLIDKTGTAEIIRNSNKSTLTLITCKHNTNKQIVIIAEML